MTTDSSLIGIAGIFIGVGGTLISSNVLTGGIMLGIAVVILVARAVLAKYGINAFSGIGKK